MGWIFGGRYVGEAIRRQLTTEDTLDIPLIRADGSLHVVELKKAYIPELVKKHRHAILGKDVHEAVSQTANYLRSLDEERFAILAKHGIECRRAAGTVVIGHPSFNREGFASAEIAEAFRTYNAHLARLQVMHCKDLIESAQRQLDFAHDDAKANLDTIWDRTTSPQGAPGHRAR